MSQFGNLLREAHRVQGAAPGAPSTAPWPSLSAHVPEQFTLRDVAAELATPAHLAQRAPLVAILACLGSRDRCQAGPDDAAAMAAICDFVAQSIAPICREAQPDGDEGETAARDAAAGRSRDVGAWGLEALRAASGGWSAQLSDEALLTVAAFAAPGGDSDSDSDSDGDGDGDGDDAWATPDAKRLAAEVLERQLAGRDVDGFLAEPVLGGYLRPLFSRSRPAAVTASGRKAEFADEADPHRGLEQETARVKPWKYLDLRAVPVFDWAVDRADETLVSRQWPLFVPVVLTLVDDPATAVRARGLRVLAALLGKLPDRVLRDTGLGSVFEDAVFPTLLHLPGLTPEAESVRLLGPVYAALRALAAKTPGGAARGRLLDRTLREGVLAGYFHAREHVRVVDVLLRQAGLLVAAMGWHAVKHLKDLMPMYAATMVDPFAASHPASLLSAIRALQVTISVCWPRVARTTLQDEMIRALVVCWLNTLEDESPAGDEVKAELVKAARTLAAVVTAAGDDDFQAKVAPLVAREPLLGGLFAPAASPAGGGGGGGGSAR